MADFLMPSLGADMTKGTLVAWLKKPGDVVHRGDLVAEVETEKGIIEIETFMDGTMDRFVVEEGQEAKVGEVLAILRADGEPREEPKTEARPDGQRKEAAVASVSPGAHLKLVQPAAHIRVSPAARRRAEELGVDLGTVKGSGPDGVITLEDVDRTPPTPAAATPSPEPREAASATAAQAAKPAGPDLGAMRHAIAANMARAKREIPHYYVSTTVDMTPALAWLENYNAGRPPGERLLSLVLVMKAAALALKRVPNLNGQFGKNGLERSDVIHIGTAIALRGGGLVAPAIFDVDQLPLPRLMEQLRDLSGRARAGRMRRTELADGTFTVTSLGDGGVETMIPIISPPQVGILAMGSVVERPWVVEGDIVPRKVVHLTVAGDHRAGDGRHGARFLEILTQFLQDPEKL